MTKYASTRCRWQHDKILMLLEIWNDTQENITQVLPAFFKCFVPPFIWFAYIKCRPICFLARSQNNRLISDHSIEVAPRDVGCERLKKVFNFTSKSQHRLWWTLKIINLPWNRDTDCGSRASCKDRRLWSCSHHICSPPHHVHQGQDLLGAGKRRYEKQTIIY